MYEQFFICRFVNILYVVGNYQNCGLGCRLVVALLQPHLLDVLGDSYCSILHREMKSHFPCTYNYPPGLSLYLISQNMMGSNLLWVYSSLSLGIIKECLSAGNPKIGMKRIKRFTVYSQNHREREDFIQHKCSRTVELHSNSIKRGRNATKIPSSLYI